MGRKRRKRRGLAKLIWVFKEMWRVLQLKERPQCPIIYVDDEGIGHWRCHYLLVDGVCPEHGRIKKR